MNTKNKEFLIFIISLIFFISIFLILYLSHGESFMIRSDSRGYLQLAENIKEGVFSRSEILPYIKETFRVPLYPALISIMPSLFILGIFQMFLLALTSLYIFKIGNNILQNKWAAIIAPIIFGIDLFTISSFGTVQTESLFVPIFIIGIYYFLLFIKNNKIKPLIISAVLIGLSALVRPVSFYLLLGIPLLYIFINIFHKRKSFILILRNALLFLVISSLIISPWIMRNKTNFDKISLSSVKEYNFYFWNLATYHARELEVSKDQVQEKLVENLRIKYPDLIKEEVKSFKYNDYYNEEIRRILRENKGEYIREHITGSLYLFVSNYWRKSTYIMQGLTDDELPIVDSMGIIKEGRIMEFVKNMDLAIFLMIMGFGLSFLIVLFMIINIFFLFKRHTFQYEIFLYGILAYFSLVTGPVGSGPYRYPILPIMLLLSVLGLSSIIKYVKTTRRKTS